MYLGYKQPSAILGTMVHLQVSGVCRFRSVLKKMFCLVRHRKSTKFEFVSISIFGRSPDLSGDELGELGGVIYGRVTFDAG